jgi:hypothetical protein
LKAFQFPALFYIFAPVFTMGGFLKCSETLNSLKTFVGCL